MKEAVARHPMEEHYRNGGSTIDPRTGASFAGRNEWATSTMPESEWIGSNAPTPEEYDAFVAQHQDIFGRHGNSAVGTHYDPQTGLHHMTVVAVTPSKKAAMDHASRLGEKTIYHTGRAEHAIVGDENRPDMVSSTFDERFEAVRNATPLRAPFQGTHYSDAKLDMIDGSRRGASGIGAEAQRLRLEPQAPAGFHVYKDGSLPDAAMAGKKFANRVQGNFSFATTDSDEFKGAYTSAFTEALAQGKDRAVAHGIALNTAEHSVRDAGFDGYYNARYPNSRFIFGSHALRGQNDQTNR